MKSRTHAPILVPIPLDAGDVRVVPYRRAICSECGEREVGFSVLLDIRNLGEEHCMGTYCSGCAQATAARIREALPK